jgi:hypothetical protein
MPDFVPVARSIEWTILAQHVGGKKLYNVGHCETHALPTLADCLNAVDALTTFCHDDYVALFSDQFTIVEIKARSNAEEPGPIAYNTTIAATGTLTGDPYPMATACRVHTTTGLTGQSQHGAFYAFPPNESQVTAGLFNSVYRGSLENILLALNGYFAAVDLTNAIESRRHLDLYPIIAFNARAIPAHLRSRRPDRGI